MLDFFKKGKVAVKHFLSSVRFDHLKVFEIFSFHPAHTTTAAFSKILQSESFVFGDRFSSDMCKANPLRVMPISNNYRYVQRPRHGKEPGQ